MIVEIEFDRGGKAEANALDGLVFTFVGARAFAPGAPIRFAVVIGEQRRVLEGRCISSKRVDETRFAVRMRFVNLRREDKEALAAKIEN